MFGQHSGCSNGVCISSTAIQCVGAYKLDFYGINGFFETLEKLSSTSRSRRGEAVDLAAGYEGFGLSSDAGGCPQRRIGVRGGWLLR